MLVIIVFRNSDIESYVGKGRLKSDARRNVYVEDKFLKSLFYFIKLQSVVAYERRQEGVKIGESLGSGSFTLQGIKEIDNLP